MKKRLFYLAFSLVLALSLLAPLFVTAQAALPYGYIFDESGVISEEDLENLNLQASAVLDRTNVAILFFRTNEEIGAREYTEQQFQANTITNNAIALGITGTQWYILFSGMPAQFAAEGDDDALWQAYLAPEGYYLGVAGYINAAEALIRSYTDSAMTDDHYSQTAFGQMHYVIDNAELMSKDDAAALETKLRGLSEQYGTDIVVLTAKALDPGKNAMEMADDYYDFHDYKPDGILLLLAMESRDWWVSTKGFGITAVTDAGLDYMSDQFLPYISDGNYAAGFNKFADLCGSFLSQAKEGDPYDIGSLPVAPGQVLIRYVIAVGAGLLIGTIIMSRYKRQLKTVQSQVKADSYVREGSMAVTGGYENFLYSHVNRVRKPEPESRSGGGSSTHTSSSGSSHGGGGGKF